MNKRPNYKHDAYHMPLAGIPVQDTAECTGVAPKKPKNRRIYKCEECRAHDCNGCEYAYKIEQS